ncbi:MAG: DUF3426 domain-containing protein [Syntrophales bacterium]|nr:DUF3426 domain-containing protein [Syntrophales bacterium]
MPLRKIRSHQPFLAFPLVPVSSSQAIMGSVIGIGLIKGGRGIRWRVLGEISMAWVATPIAAVFIANLLSGNLRVIEGVAVNQAPYPLSKIRVRLTIADAYDVVLGEKVVFGGNILTDAELGAMTEAEIQRELSIPQGSDVANERIAQNGEIPFMIVFNQDQAGAVKKTVAPAGADRLP